MQKNVQSFHFIFFLRKSLKGQAGNNKLTSLLTQRNKMLSFVTEYL